MFFTQRFARLSLLALLAIAASLFVATAASADEPTAPEDVKPNATPTKPAEEKPAAPDEKTTPAEKPAPSADQLAQWIKDLDSEEFNVRDEATRKLTEAGDPAIETLVKALATDSGEVAARVSGILKKHLKSKDGKLRAKVLSVFHSNGLGENTTLLGRRMAAITAPDPNEKSTEPPQLQAGGIILGGGGIIINNGQFTQVRRSDVNGTKTIDVTQNGRATHLEEAPTGEITGSVTETVAGKESVTKFTAKNAEDLKKQNPDAADIRDKFGGGGAAAIVINGGQLVIGNAQVNPGLQIGQRPAVDPQVLSRLRLRGSSGRLKSSIDVLKQNQAQLDKESADELGKVIEQLEDAYKKLGTIGDKSEKAKSE